MGTTTTPPDPPQYDKQTMDIVNAAKQLAGTHDVLNDPELDRRTGAGLGATMAVGAAPTKADELSTLKKFYPDAKPFGEDNYAFTHPDTGRQTLYKPTEGTHPLTWLARNAEEVPTLLGGGVGGFLGGVAGGAAGGPPGAVAGAAIGAGGGANAALEAYRGFMGMLMGTDDTRTPMQHFTDAVKNTTLNAAGEGVGRVAAGGLRTAAIPIVGRAEPGITQAAKDVGVDLSGMPAMNTGSRGLNTTIQALRSVPTATDIVDAGTEGARSQLTAAQQRITSNLASAPERATADTQTAMERLLGAGQKTIDTYNQVRTAMGGAVDALGQGVMAIPHNIQNTVTRMEEAAVKGSDDLKKSYADAIAWGRGILDKSRENGLATGRPGIEFPTMRQQRTVLGENIDFNPGSGAKRTSTEQANMQTMYDAARQDLLDSADRSNPALKNALVAHDELVTSARGGQGNMSPTVGPGQYMTVDDLGKLVEKNPSDAFDSVMANSFKSGMNGGDGTELMRVRNTVGDKAWRDFASHVWDRMFQPTPSTAQTAAQVAGEEPVSGVAQFVTKWNAMSPGAKRALFDGYLPDGQRQQLDSFAQLANQFVRAGYDRNFSNTTNVAAAGSAFTQPFSHAADLAAKGHLIAAPVMLVAGLSKLASAPMLARLLQSPEFTRWLSSSSREVMASPNRLPTAVARLGAMQFNNPATQNAVNRYMMTVMPGDPGASP